MILPAIRFASVIIQYYKLDIESGLTPSTRFFNTSQPPNQNPEVSSPPRRIARKLTNKRYSLRFFIYFDNESNRQANRAAAAGRDHQRAVGETPMFQGARDSSGRGQRSKSGFACNHLRRHPWTVL